MSAPELLLDFVYKMKQSVPRRFGSHSRSLEHPWWTTLGVRLLAKRGVWPRTSNLLDLSREVRLAWFLKTRAFHDR